jgi:hypothetical protein
LTKHFIFPFSPNGDAENELVVVVEMSHQGLAGNTVPGEKAQ